MSIITLYLPYAVFSFLTAAFGFAGAMKLTGAEQAHFSFGMMGLPWWFGYFIGAAEVCGAVGLWIKPLRFWAGAGFAVIMAGAIYFHLTLDKAANGIPSFVLFAASVCTFSVSKRYALLLTK